MHTKLLIATLSQRSQVTNELSWQFTELTQGKHQTSGGSLSQMTHSDSVNKMFEVENFRKTSRSMGSMRSMRSDPSLQKALHHVFRHASAPAGIHVF